MVYYLQLLSLLVSWTTGFELKRSQVEGLHSYCGLVMGAHKKT